MSVKAGCARLLVLVVMTLGLSSLAAPSTMAASNPIVAENQQAGSQGWKLGSLVSDDTSKQVKGFASASSVRAGDSLSFYVTVNPAQTFDLDVYRIGWYGGAGGRLRLHAAALNGVTQPACPMDATTGLMACTNWSASYTTTIPSDWTSGVYLAKLTNAAGYQNYIIFVVRDDRPAAFLYQSSLNTAEAYNNYPNDGTGKSLYDYNSNGANTIVGSKRAAKVSFDRPFSGNGGAGIFLSYEIQFLRWAEHSGYDLTYSADSDTHANPAGLLNHRGFISAGHDEYWSKQMYDAARSARDAGVSLAFLGSNAIYYQARYEASDSGVPNRVLVCYKNAAIDPIQGPTTTVFWRDPVLNRPEQTLIGIQYTSESGPGHNVAYVVNNSTHWIYAGTGFHDGDSVPGIVGYEEDRYMSNYPAAAGSNWTLLSQSPYTSTDAGPDYANSSIYQAASGAWVFATGTMSWGWALDSYYNSGTPVDSRIQQTTANMLNAFLNGAPVVSRLTVTPASTGSTAGQASALTVSAVNSMGNPVAGYAGTVHFSSTDPSATLPADYTFSATDGGVHQFSLTLTRAGNQTVTASDVANGSLAGSQSIAVSPAAAASLSLSGLSDGIAGNPQTAIVTVSDVYGNAASGYVGTVRFTSTDTQALLPPDYTFTGADAGVHRFPVTLKTAGSQTVSTTDLANGSLSASQTIAISPPAASSISVSGLASASAGTSQTLTVTVYGSNGALATGYTGTVHFSSTDARADLPADYTFTGGDAGVHQFGVTLKTAGAQTVTATDVANGSLAGSQSLTISPGPAATLGLAGLSSAVVGTAQTGTVTLADAYGNPAAGYTGTVHFTSTDAQASLPADYAFTRGDAGSHRFALTLNSAGSQTVTVTDTANATLTAQQTVAISAPPAARLALSGLNNAMAGAIQTVTVTAYASDGALATGYTGTVHLSSTDGQALMPADYTFTAGDAGAHDFTLTLKTAGNQSVTASDTAISSLATSQTASISPGPAARLALGLPGTATAGTAQTATVSLFDAYGNAATGYAGTVHFSSADVQAVLPADYTFSAADAAVHQFAVTLKTAGNQIVNANDVTYSSLSASQTVVLSPAAASMLSLSGLAGGVAGSQQTATVTMLDPYGNRATGYTGSVGLTSSDAQAVLPSPYTFVTADAGAHQFPVTLKTAGSQSVTAADTAVVGLTSSRAVTITPAAAASARLRGLADGVAGSNQSATVGLYDAFGNVATGYQGTMHLVSTDAQAVLPSDYTFSAADAGVHQFSLMLKTAGSQTVTATDIATASLASSQTVAISPAPAASLRLTGLSNSVAGTAQPVMVKLFDPYANVATGYNGTVHFSSTDRQAGLPADYNFAAADQGSHQFSITLRTAGSQTLTATDGANATLTANQTAQIAAAAAANLSISVPSKAVANQPFTATVRLTDQFGNVATGYRGTIHFTSSDLLAQTLGNLPADYTFTSADAGTHAFTVTLVTTGNQTITATDTVKGTLSGTSSPIAVSLL